jgi:hypothetical protein
MLYKLLLVMLITIWLTTFAYAEDYKIDFKISDTLTIAILNHYRDKEILNIPKYHTDYIWSGIKIKFNDSLEITFEKFRDIDDRLRPDSKGFGIRFKYKF